VHVVFAGVICPRSSVRVVVRLRRMGLLRSLRHHRLVLRLLGLLNRLRLRVRLRLRIRVCVRVHVRLRLRLLRGVGAMLRSERRRERESHPEAPAEAYDGAVQLLERG
jgi:hypothetical protein